jgi:hypothetical protein
MNISRKGFTLIGPLVVIATIAILFGQLLPAVERVREAAARIEGQSDLRRLAIACHNYHDNFQRFPHPVNLPGKDSFRWPAAPDPNKWYSLTMALFPYIEQDHLRRNLVDNVWLPQIVNCNGPNSVGAQAVKILVSPSDTRWPAIRRWWSRSSRATGRPSAWS